MPSMQTLASAAAVAAVAAVPSLAAPAAAHLLPAAPAAAHLLPAAPPAGHAALLPAPGPPVPFPPPECYTYEYCRGSFVVSPTSAFEYDLCGLCVGSGAVYNVSVPSAEQYALFNIGGAASALCAPQGYPVTTSVFGAAVYFGGPAPPCTPPGDCTDPATGAPVCCTSACEPIGALPPTCAVSDPANPATGGVVQQYAGIMASPADPFQCPVNPITGQPGARTLTVTLACDPQGSTSELADVSFQELAPCAYFLNASTAAACGIPFTPS
jgi:hypothetical protein